MKFICPCCQDELTIEDRMNHIQQLAINLDEGGLFDDLSAKQVKEIIHKIIDLSTLEDGLE